MKTEQLLAKLRRGSIEEAFEAAKSLSNLPRLSAKRITSVLDEAKDIHNREAATYALSWLHRKDRTESLQALLNIFNDTNENPSVRGQALEGLGIQRPAARHKLWPDVEKAVLDGLKSDAVEVRFWACYAAGTLQIKSALPQLQELAQNDPMICPKWWRVSEEATDAIEWIHGRNTETRVPIAG
jgi:HEAT repeat protein